MLSCNSVELEGEILSVLQDEGPVHAAACAQEEEVVANVAAPQVVFVSHLALYCMAQLVFFLDALMVVLVSHRVLYCKPQLVLSWML